MPHNARMRASVLVGLCVALAACGERPPATLSVAEQLGGLPAEGFARAEGPRAFRFPADHGPHPEYRNEWWYFTGNLDAADGRRLGFQATFFRIGLDARPAPRASQWATRDAWMAHLAVSDGTAKKHVAAERFARGAAGLAGATTEPIAVWLEDWRLSSADGETWQLTATTPAIHVDLTLHAIRPVVLQGDAGLSQKSTEPGNASYYYSVPRLSATGTLGIDGQRHAARGLAWLDREWSTSALGPDQAGWDWVALQFADGSDLMYYRLRRKDGSVDPLSKGSLVDAGGARRDLGPDLGLTPRRWWTAPGGARYPVEWDLRLPGEDRALRVSAVFDDQLMALAVRYWEGMVDVRDAASGDAVGRGYLEMTGY
jgi:predicted secreted hydrolase